MLAMHCAISTIVVSHQFVQHLPGGLRPLPTRENLQRQSRGCRRNVVRDASTVQLDVVTVLTFLRNGSIHSSSGRNFDAFLCTASLLADREPRLNSAHDRLV